MAQSVATQVYLNSVFDWGKSQQEFLSQFPTATVTLAEATAYYNAKCQARNEQLRQQFRAFPQSYRRGNPAKMSDTEGPSAIGPSTTYLNPAGPFDVTEEDIRITPTELFAKDKEYNSRYEGFITSMPGVYANIEDIKAWMKTWFEVGDAFRNDIAVDQYLVKCSMTGKDLQDAKVNFMLLWFWTNNRHSQGTYYTEEVIYRFFRDVQRARIVDAVKRGVLGVREQTMAGPAPTKESKPTAGPAAAADVAGVNEKLGGLALGSPAKKKKSQKKKKKGSKKGKEPAVEEEEMEDGEEGEEG
ncbi:hypothetical protein G7Y89_g1171 [Cudoniella acicularis]|uniref:Uncharacterized protein n=1 Tax=Cudoniella acicularis TaxID=354080 RepID=A0A8H4RVS8_9HELO|nr:hypothetical protein G7Y89_g1171 [Cudoniella acicularis]